MQLNYIEGLDLQFLQCIFRTIGYGIVRIALEGHPRRVVLTLVIIWSAGQPSNSELPTQCLLLIADISSARSAGYNVLLEAISLYQLTSALLKQDGRIVTAINPEEH